MTKAAATTPVRDALLLKSSLRPRVVDGMGAIRAVHHDYFEVPIRPAFADSLDLDEALKHGHEQESRWDYLLGHSPSGDIVAVEPHSARQDEIATVVKKRSAAREQLKGHLRDGVHIVKWLWVASGKVHFADTEKVRRLLDQNGIEFVGKKVVGKHLPLPPIHRSPAAKGKRRKGKQ